MAGEMTRDDFMSKTRDIIFSAYLPPQNKTKTAFSQFIHQAKLFFLVHVVSAMFIDMNG